ncbi:hypothetical protein SCLCIDRAFT_1130662 [Scleroderma citrinum Foug A]|uniref:Uncharacterized protein n=1 Tax=Scleroderma citrinum Foug A TaxID=1036808 RepID=A0A0C3DNR6_9AGAM|nr:hypothetical protein SCLCIDRAFT_1130662 [Scleroderma citrinum Foug A]
MSEVITYGRPSNVSTDLDRRSTLFSRARGNQHIPNTDNTIAIPTLIYSCPHAANQSGTP